MNTNEIMKVTPNEGNRSGYHLARYYELFPLNMLFRSLLAPLPLMHSERYTDVYFQTRSGNAYKISKVGDNWVLIDKNGKTKYRMLPSEMIYAFLKKGERFYFADGFSTEVISIIAVDRNIIRMGISSNPDAQLVAYFESSLKIKGVIAKM